jgi:mono/diheme cytochrome c family protein
MRTILILMALLGLLTSCNSKPPSAITYASVPQDGDPVRGEQLFTAGTGGTAPCGACHTANNPASPDMEGYGERAENRVAGQDAWEYTFYSITEPWRFIVEGYGNAMPNNYDEVLTPQDIADLIAYLLTR